MNRIHTINEDFFDDNQIDTTSDTADIDDACYGHELSLCIGGVNKFEDYDNFLKHFKKIDKKIHLFLDYCPQISNCSEIHYSAGGNKTLSMMNLETVFKNNKPNNIYATVDINANFENLKHLSRFVSTLFKLITNTMHPCLYVSRIDELSGYEYKNIDINLQRFIMGMNLLAKEYIDIEKPFMEIAKLYKINFQDKISVAMLGRYGNNNILPRQPDLQTAQFNTIRLYAPGFFEDENGLVSYHMDTDEVTRHYMAQDFKSEDAVRDICEKALEFARNSVYGAYPFVYQQNGGYGGVCCVFNETFVYNKHEYVIAASYEFNANVAKYYISKEDVQKVKTEIVDSYRIPSGSVDKFCEDLRWNN